MNSNPIPKPTTTQPQSTTPRRRRSKIANLPKHDRDCINRQLDNGDPYSAIIKLLAEDGIQVTRHPLE